MQINLAKEEVLIETALTSLQVQSLIESTGRRAVLKGMGSSESGASINAVHVKAHGEWRETGLMFLICACVFIRPGGCRGNGQWAGASAGCGPIPAAVTGTLFD